MIFCRQHLSKMISPGEGKVKMQEDLNNIIYKWVEENLIEFSEEKFEQLAHGKTCDKTVSLYM